MTYDLLLDIGNVIVTFDFGLIADRIAPHCRTPQDEIVPSLADLMDEFERGSIGERDFFDSASDRLGYRKKTETIDSAFLDIFELNRPMIALIEEQAADRNCANLFLLSNTNPTHYSYLLERYSIFGKFDAGITSFEARSMKPESEIYQFAISHLNLDPAKTIYVDDRPENCEQGLRHGLISICYDHREHDSFLNAFQVHRSRLIQ